jgi:hypothetical protein
MADIKLEKVVSSLFGDYLDAPLVPEYAFKSAQQSFRFILEVSGLNVAFITDVKRPAVSIEYQEYDYLGYATKFPKKLKWESISFTVIETFDPRALGTVLGNLLHKVQTTAYTYPTNIIPDGFNNLSKKNLINDFGNINIRTIDPDGSVVDTWRIYNPMITKITPSQLKYSSDELTNISVDLVYDWAEYYLSNDIRPGKIAKSGIDLAKNLF